MKTKTLWLLFALFILVVTIPRVFLVSPRRTLEVAEPTPQPPALSANEPAIQPITPKRTTVFLTGDVMLGRTVMSTALDAGDPLYPFRNVADRMQGADVTFLNLENPIIGDCARHSGGFTFCTPPSIAEGLSYAGVDVVSIANNHSRNYGQQGFDETKMHLQALGVAHVGDGNLVTRDVNDVVFGFLGFDFFSNTPTQADYDLVRQSDAKVDVLIVGVHWGIEYQAVHSPNQRQIAEQIVAAGADSIAGHHPHWVQDKEYIDGKPVYYSFGNFIFDQMWSEETKKGLAVILTFENGQLVGEEELPVYIPVFGQPVFVAQ